MFRKIGRKQILSLTVCAAVLTAANPGLADSNGSIVDLNIDWDSLIHLMDTNTAVSEGALGARNTNFTQTALSQLNVMSAIVSAGQGYDVTFDLLVDLGQYTGSDHAADETEQLADGRVALRADNFAAAWTTQYDAFLKGSQVGLVGFNTASVDIASGGEDVSALIGLDQTLDGVRDDSEGDDSEYYDRLIDLEMGVLNQMDAVAAYAGTAKIDGAIVNPDYLIGGDEPFYLSSAQQAVASLNTLAISSEADVVVELSAQGFDVEGFAGRHYSAGEGSFVEDEYYQYFKLSTENIALAFAPRPASAKFIDPSISYLDQIAAISMNTMSFGTAPDGDVPAGEEDYTLMVDVDASYDGYAQFATFSDSETISQDFPSPQEIILGNIMAATTSPEVYLDLGGALYSDDAMEYFYMRDYGIGDVSLTEVSQTAMATINSIRQNGEGDLTLTAGYYDAIDEDSLGGYEDEYVFLPEDFVQTIENLDLLVSAATAGPDDLSSSALNFAEASTNVGDVAISELSQQAQFGFNSITSGGDIEGWNALDRYGIVQIGGSDSYDASLSAAHTNFIYGRTSLGDIDVAGLEQIANVSMNHVYAGNDLGANLTQLSEFQVAATDDVNDVLLVSLAKGGLVLDELSQVAALRMNSVSVVDEISSMALVQDADNLGELSYSEGINDVSAQVDTGNVSVEGVEQTALITSNTVSAGNIATSSEDGYGIVQNTEGLGYSGQYVGDSVNEIDVQANDAGNASLLNGTQTFVLNLNTVSSTGSVSGNVSQEASDINLDVGAAQNSAFVYANQDIAGRRNVGGNASINGLVQTLAANVNTLSAGSLDGANINQVASDINSPLSNYAMADSEWGTASVDGVAQTAINRVNHISINTVAGSN